MSYSVYLLKSIKSPDKFYAGYTTSIKDRLATHNSGSGGSIHTKRDRPWELVVCLAFKDMDCAKQFEKYLKSPSGRAFAKKRFWQQINFSFAGRPVFKIKLKFKLLIVRFAKQDACLMIREAIIFCILNL